MDISNIISVLVGAAVASILSYVTGRIAKFDETKTNLLFEKIKQYEALQADWLFMLTILMDPEFVTRWNARHLPTHDTYNVALVNINKAYLKVSFISSDMNLMHQYLFKKIGLLTMNPQTGQLIQIQSPITDLIRDIFKKTDLMKELIRYECDLDSAYKIFFQSFFEYDLSKMDGRSRYTKWRASKNSDFQEIEEYCKSNSTLPVF